ncbi:1-acyl-sn-glycerol-3-phosphate acyltransferase [Thalassoglobus neptunius]|uniref:1-acyl-sn-glycerol-3-phosphate acyltransferase n=1 Tax=Thalassoglobus neptunius TaxID=1938619 RepID=A0A5C5X3K4_9PLAN|nr:lysophospholipid acyltransferase family protein [Thalassoglobus neptunius]TWT57614.1 1-acyl-sn-glycerol-3-phosphate acyltransferase [Thalassoglobus neptunius]
MSDSEELPDPLDRNLCWRTIQVALQFLFAIWFGYRAKGIEHLPKGGALFLVNHQSFLDPLLVGLPLRRPVSFLARDNLFKVPVVGWILRNTYVMSIRRESAGTESLRKSIARVQHGFYVGLFPEGTRTLDSQLGNIKPGFISIARRGGVPIVPVGISGAFEAMPKNSFWIRPTRVRVVFGKPIPAERVAQLSQKDRQEEFLSVVSSEIDGCRRQAEKWRNGETLEDMSVASHSGEEESTASSESSGGAGSSKDSM